MEIANTTRLFKDRFYADISDEDWMDWRWQIRNRLRNVPQLDRVLTLTPEERAAIDSMSARLPVGVTPYYASVLMAGGQTSPLRKTHIPVGDELRTYPDEYLDPLSEDLDTVVPGIVHRYPDRVLFLVTGFCATYCRYCTRSRMVGDPYNDYEFSLAQWDRAFEYIEKHHEIRDVLISGGDPLTLGDDKLSYLLSRLDSIRHVEFVRVGSKVPIVLPMRITDGLLDVLKRHSHPWISLHITHPDEFTDEVKACLSLLSDAGVPLGSQTVLLKGVNDDVETMRILMHLCLANRVRPYYLYQCDPIFGSRHFRTPIRSGLDIISGLQGFTTGYGVPQYVIDLPHGGGKVPLSPHQPIERDGNTFLIKNYEGKVFTIIDPLA